MVVQKRKRKRRLKSSFKRFCIFTIFFLAVFIYALHESIAIYEFYQYRKTDEYKILSLGYNEKETDRFLDLLNKEQIQFILENPYNEDYYALITQKYYLSKNFSKYVEYKLYNEETSYEDVIAIVNTHVNEGWYNVTFSTDLSKDYLLLVNKFYHLEKDYKREDLQNISLQYAYADNMAAPIVIESFEKMYQEVKKELGVSLMINSSYRSFEEQENTYNAFRKNDDIAARPGYSEHQTGLTLDLTSLEHPYADQFTESDEYKWLKENCHHYGFIHRYPEDKTYITGYQTESWHFRYVGVDAATKMYNEHITLEEYYAYYIEK